MSGSKELIVSTAIEIDKSDIADIAIAEAESRIKQSIKSLTEESNSKKLACSKATKLVEELGKELVEKKLKAQLALIKKGLSITKIPNIQVNQIVAINKSFNIDNETSLSRVNQSEISIVIPIPGNPTKNNNQSLHIQSDSFPATKPQITARKNAVALADSYRKLNIEILEYRKKLGDIPSLERWVRGQLAKKQLQENPDGKKIVDSLLKAMDGNVKLLGV